MKFTVDTLTVLTVLSFLLIMSDQVDAYCSYRGSKVCDGAVTKEMKSMVQICLNGRLTYRKYDKIEPGYPLAGGECEWYDEVICDGAVVRDLYRWWFEARCSQNKMSVVSRSWSDVVTDPRFKNRHKN